MSTLEAEVQCGQIDGAITVSRSGENCRANGEEARFHFVSPVAKLHHVLFDIKDLDDEEASKVVFAG